MELPFLVLVVGHACTLKCLHCGNFSAAAPLRLRRYPIQDIRHDMDVLLRHAQIRGVLIQGGEPFMYPELPELLTYLRSTNRVGKIRIATNGTIIPREDVLDAVAANDVRVRISNYRNILEPEGKSLAAVLKQRSIPYNLYKFAGGESTWRNLGGVNLPRENDDAIVSRRFAECPYNICLTLDNSKLAFCSRAIVSEKVQRYKALEMDYLPITEDGDFAEKLKDYCENRRYMEACRYCLGAEGQSILPAKQIEAPTKDAVAVTTAGNYRLNAVKRSLKQLFMLSGYAPGNSLARIIKPKARVLILPNWTSANWHAASSERSIYSILTHPNVVEAVADFVALALKGAGEITIGAAFSSDVDFEALIAATGIRRLESKYAVPLSVLNIKSLYREIPQTDATGGEPQNPVCSDTLPKVIAESNVHLLIPKMTGPSPNLDVLKSVVSTSKLNEDQSQPPLSDDQIAVEIYGAINCGGYKTFAVIDGIHAGKNAESSHKLLIGESFAATDLAVSHIMGASPEQAPVLSLFLKLGLVYENNVDVRTFD